MPWLLTTLAATLLTASPAPLDGTVDPGVAPVSRAGAIQSERPDAGAAGGVVSAGYMTSSRLQDACRAADAEPDRAICLGYLEGVWDSLSVLNPVLATSDAYAFDICLPQDVRVETVAEVSLAWMQRHPERDAESAASLVILALLERFGCDRDASDRRPAGA